jgi:hypothetical protein
MTSSKGQRFVRGPSSSGTGNPADRVRFLAVGSDTLHSSARAAVPTYAGALGPIKEVMTGICAGW